MYNTTTTTTTTFPILVIEPSQKTTKTMELAGDIIEKSPSSSSSAESSPSTPAGTGKASSGTGTGISVEEETKPLTHSKTRQGKGNGQTKKSRSFSAYLVSYVCADQLWDGGQAKTEVIRPIWLRLAGSEQELRSFVANLQAGYKAAVKPAHSYSREAPVRYELLKSGGYRYVWQKAEVGGQQCAVVTIFIPALFQFDPGMVDPREAKFVVLPARWWVERELRTLRLKSPERTLSVLEHARHLGLLKSSPSSSTQKGEEEEGNGKGVGEPTGTDKPAYWQHRKFTRSELLELLPVAAYFASYLDKRTTKPLLDDLRFYIQLYLCALEEGIATLGDPPQERGNNSSGYYNNNNRPTSTHLAQKEWEWATQLSVGLSTFNLEASGVLAPICCKVGQDKLDRFLSEQVKLYFALVEGQDWRPALSLNFVEPGQIERTLASVGVVGLGYAVVSPPSQQVRATTPLPQPRPRFELRSETISVLAASRRDATRLQVTAEVAGPLAIYPVAVTAITPADPNIIITDQIAPSSTKTGRANPPAGTSVTNYKLVHLATGLPLVDNFQNRHSAIKALIEALQSPQIDWQFYHWRELNEQPHNRDNIYKLCQRLQTENQSDQNQKAS